MMIQRKDVDTMDTGNGGIEWSFQGLMRTSWCLGIEKSLLVQTIWVTEISLSLMTSANPIEGLLSVGK